MRKIAIAFILSLGSAHAALAQDAPPAEETPLQELLFEQRTYSYACEDGQSLEVSYITPGNEQERYPTFAVLRYGHGDEIYGLSQAVSASGARYIGHTGLNNASGLEWWEKGGHGTLSTFTGDDARDPVPLLTECEVLPEE